MYTEEYIYTYTHACVNTHAFILLSTTSAEYVYLHIHKHMHTYEHLRMHTYGHVHVYYMYVCTCISICIHTYTHIHVYTYICIYTHLYLHLYLSLPTRTRTRTRTPTCDFSPGNTATLARIMDKGDTGASPAMGAPPGPLRTPELLKLDRRLLAVVEHSPRKLDPSLGTEERPWAGDGAAAASTEEPPELVCVGPARVALLVVVVVGCCCPCECACACVREALAERAGRSSWLIWPWAMMSANLSPWLRSRPSRLSRPSVPDLSLALSCPAVTASLLLVLFVISRSDREFPLSVMASLLLVLPVTGRPRLSRPSRPSFPYREFPLSVTPSLLLVPCAVAW
jgi:hypothetical protein